jgi:hypothetical protein
MKITALIFTLLVTASVLPACIPIPNFSDIPGLESGLPPGEVQPTVTTRAALMDQVGYPDLRTPDERFFLYRNYGCIQSAGMGWIEIEWWIPTGVYYPYHCFARWVLVEFDNHGVVKSVNVKDCQDKDNCGAPPAALAALLEDRYGTAVAAEYQRPVAQVESAPSAVAGEPQATRFGPFSPGDSFEYRAFTGIIHPRFTFWIGDYEDTYLREENGQLVFKRAYDLIFAGTLIRKEPIGEAVCTINGNWVRWPILHSKDAVTADPHNGVLKFPMKVGMSWTHRYTLTNFMYSGIHTATMTVRKYEQIETPAGKFWAFKIERIEEPGLPTVEIYWFAPEVGLIVKFKSDEREVQLTSYHKAAKP